MKVFLLVISSVFLAVESQETSSFVWCGVHQAPTCEECVNGYGKNWCNGECTWSTENTLCIPSNANLISCGTHKASSCSDCPKGRGEAWCSGVCEWRNDKCQEREKSTQPKRASNCDVKRTKGNRDDDVGVE